MENDSKRLKMMSNKELAMFCDQMAMILKAGQTPESGISLMLEDAASEEAVRILEQSPRCAIWVSLSIKHAKLQAFSLSTH